MVVYHFSLKGAAGNFHIPLSLNRTRHRLCPRSLTGVLGIGVTEIILSTLLQSQFACRVRRVSFSVLPSVALAVGCAVFGSLREAALHDEFAGAEHHVLVRHGEFHGRLVAVDAVVRAEDPAVQAVDFGVGGDGHNLRLGRGPFSHDDVGLPIRRPIQRHTVDFRDLGFGGGRIPGDGVDTCYPVQTCFAVEHTTVYVPLIFHTAREGSTRDFSSGVVCHFFIEGSTFDISSVVVYHIALEGSVIDISGVVCHCFIECTVLDYCVGVVFHIAIEGSALDHSCVEIAIEPFT